MNEEKIAALVTYLKSLGFEKPDFEEKIRQAFENKLQQFSMEQTVLFDSESIKFDLNFWWDYQFESFKLVKYLAAYMASPDAEMVCAEYGPLARGIHNVNQVYHDLSGRFEDLYDKVFPLELSYFPGMEIYPVLREHIASNPDKFEIRYAKNEPDGFFQYVIPVEKLNGQYTLNTYTATLVPYPPIEHAVFNGIDTSILECEMSRINWSNRRETHIFQGDLRSEFKLKVLDIIDKIDRLAMEPTGAFIADQLKLKYWKDIPLLEDTLTKTALLYFKNLSKRKLILPVDYSVRIAFNALCGRAIFRERINPLMDNDPGWMRFDFSVKSSNGKYSFEVVRGFGRKEVEILLGCLSMPPKCNWVTAIDLLKGDRTWVTYDGEKKIYLEANPEQKTINVYSETMAPIMVNFLLDPDWTPLLSREVAANNPKKMERKSIKKRRILPDKPIKQARKR
ncbi:hypothetical protein [Niabella beijingensis]|uniref:hypothetical protein n=1 Tax=Niabella beijingensis TaxID=2872700 RepID=UPI001CBC0F1F|nr:hypothetical protein [Niabella beijingensis]MBZ4188970.1 hypothetical protein [Niabella beijingensis]